MIGHYQTEVVDDSEPEREELRRRMKGQHKRDLGDTISTKRTRLPVIEVSDDEPSDGQRPTSVSSPKKAHLDISINQAHSDTISNKTESDNDDGELKISLARFAYLGAMNAKASTSGTGLSRQSSIMSTTSENQPRSTKRPTHRFTAYFSDSDLGLVTKCVGCDIRWTARKTAAQKMLHIQSCAKKMSLTDETIRILLRKEIDSHKTDIKGKEKATAADPQTYLEEVIAESVPKKKGRRVEVQETVKNISQTRDFILDRAKNVLGLGDRIFQAIEICDSERLPSTQAFGDSALANPRTTNSLFDHVIGGSSGGNLSYPEIPSNTQTFAPSRLGRLHSSYVPKSIVEQSPGFTTNDASVSSRSPSTVDVADDSTRETIPPRTTPLERFSAPPPQMHSPFLPDRDDSPFLLYNRSISAMDSEWENDDVILHFNPEVVPFDKVDEPPVDPPSSTPRQSKSKPIAPKTPPSKKQKKSSPKNKILTSATKTNSPSKRGKTPAKSRSMVESESTEALETRMMELIMGDTNLYLRVLRYEPIHFDVFLQLALGDSQVPASKLKLRLRTFLDKQAIHFYGLEGTTRRQRRVSK